MTLVRALRVTLALEAGALALPIVIAFAVAGYELFHKLNGSCAYESCAVAAPFLAMGAAIVFGGPVWWAASGARRAPRLTIRQLGWLLAVNAYVTVVAVDLWAQTHQDMNAEAPLSVALTFVTMCAVVATALVSTAACGARMLDLRRPTASPL